MTSQPLNKILHTSFQLFTKYGVRSVSMDDIARELGMSKKTLYQYIDNKADLIKRTLQVYFKQEECSVAKNHETSENAIEEMVAIANFVSQHLKRMNPTAMYDIRKYYPDSWQLVEEHKNKFVYHCITKNIERGIQEGLYRKNTQAKIIAKVYISHFEIFSDSSFFIEQELHPLTAYKEMFKYHIYGIASKKGIEYLQKNIDKIKLNQYVNYF